MTEQETAESQTTIQDHEPSPPVDSATADALTQEITELTQRLAAAEAKAAEHRDAMLRAIAETDNVRRRTERDLENAHKFALERFTQELLPVIDSLEMGLQAAQAQDVSIASLQQGSELILKKFESLLGKFNVAAINPLDQPFNPELHQAVSMVPVPDKAPNTVVSVLQKGYTLNDRLVRPAMVVVAQG
jgi:molecular chaperone GrpE